jgi:hypothetical protein
LTIATTMVPLREPVRRNAPMIIACREFRVLPVLRRLAAAVAGIENGISRTYLLSQGSLICTRG